MAWGRWAPDEGLEVQTWLDFGPPGWHVRLHRIVTDRPLRVAEGGFSVDRTGDGHITPPDWIREGAGFARVRTLSALSILADLSGSRDGQVIRAAPNTNLLFPRTFFPRLAGEVTTGTAWIGTASYGMPDPEVEPAPFEMPQTARDLLDREGVAHDDWAIRGPCDPSPRSIGARR
jgi:hypothetical protein